MRQDGKPITAFAAYVKARTGHSSKKSLTRHKCRKLIWLTHTYWRWLASSSLRERSRKCSIWWMCHFRPASKRPTHRAFSLKWPCYGLWLLTFCLTHTENWRLHVLTADPALTQASPAPTFWSCDHMFTTVHGGRQLQCSALYYITGRRTDTWTCFWIKHQHLKRDNRKIIKHFPWHQVIFEMRAINLHHRPASDRADL